MYPVFVSDRSARWMSASSGTWVMNTSMAKVTENVDTDTYEQVDTNSRVNARCELELRKVE
jgi:hypothetical protein